MYVCKSAITTYMEQLQCKTHPVKQQPRCCCCCQHATCPNLSAAAHERAGCRTQGWALGQCLLLQSTPILALLCVRRMFPSPFLLRAACSSGKRGPASQHTQHEQALFGSSNWMLETIQASNVVFFECSCCVRRRLQWYHTDSGDEEELQCTRRSAGSEADATPYCYTD